MSPHTKPYKRLWRPVKGYDCFGFMETPLHPSIDYLLDERFANQREMRSLVTTAHLIIQDLYNLFNYIEPADENLKTYSHRIYELLLRTSTEFEANCKAILETNGYKGASTIIDYFNISQFAKLSGYTVSFNRWCPNREFRPFESWGGSEYAPLPWYRAYNDVKHNRYSCFNQANLENLMNAIAGLLCVLHAQYGGNMADACYEGISAIQQSESRVTTETFVITTPIFEDYEMYNFIWDNLKNDTDPVLSFNFKQVDAIPPRDG